MEQNAESQIDELVKQYRNDDRWAQATDAEMREWARVELFGTDAERAEHREIESKLEADYNA